MKRRRQLESILVIALLASTTFASARGIPPRRAEAGTKRVARQADDFGSMSSLISLGLKVFPLIMNAYNTFLGSGDGGGLASALAGPSPVTNSVDRVETPPADPFSWSNLIGMGIKVALAVLSSYSNDGIDKSDTISPTEAIMGTVISALTGSQDPKEVATMAKQADEVIGLFMTLVEALKTSFSG